MITRREAVRLLGSASGAWLAASSLSIDSFLVPKAFARDKEDSTPPLAPGLPQSPQRIALIDAFKKQSEGLEKKYEARTLKGEWTMPYRLFRPGATGSCHWWSICMAAEGRETTT